MKIDQISKILVLGSNSFAGSWFIDAALRKKIRVVAVSRSKEKNLQFLKNIHPK